MKIHFDMGEKNHPERLSTRDEMVAQAQKEHSRAFQDHMPYVRLHRDFAKQKAKKMGKLRMRNIGEQ
jgi:hypothetical protein